MLILNRLTYGFQRCHRFTGKRLLCESLILENALYRLDKLGLTKDNEVIFKKMIAKPNGIVLITGPTGSGKFYLLMMKFVG